MFFPLGENLPPDKFDPLDAIIILIIRNDNIILLIFK
jgi:hypothetical protein